MLDNNINTAVHHERTVMKNKQGLIPGISKVLKMVP
jgi:hypothetical protein